MAWGGTLAQMHHTAIACACCYQTPDGYRTGSVCLLMWGGVVWFSGCWQKKQEHSSNAHARSAYLSSVRGLLRTHEDLRRNPIHLALSPYRAGSDVSALRCSCETNSQGPFRKRYS